MGDCYSLLVEYEGRKILVHGSAGFIPNALDKYKADVVYLGVGAFGIRENAFKEEYWNQVVGAVNARRVIIIHWDDFFRKLTSPLTPQSWPIDNFSASLDFLNTAAGKYAVDVRIPVIWEPANPFFNLD